MRRSCKYSQAQPKYQAADYISSDIVDHKHCDAHVPDIVIGSISSYNDEMEDRVNDTL